MELFLDSDGDGMEQLGDEPSESVREWRFIRAAEELTAGTAGDADGCFGCSLAVAAAAADGCFVCSLAIAGAAAGCFGCSLAVAAAAAGSFGCSLAVAGAADGSFGCSLAVAAADGLLLAGLSPAGPLLKKPCASSFILSLTWTEEVSGLSAASWATSEVGFSARPLCAPLSLLTRSADLADGLADCRRSRGLMRRPGRNVVMLFFITY
jgi:hypothetical protein